MGFTTYQVQVLVPSAFFFFSFRRPLPTAVSESGTVILSTAPCSGSSLWWSLHGNQTLAPSPWQATLIHGRPFSSFFHIHPPSQGGLTASRGFPWYQMVRLAVVALPCLGINTK